MKHSIIKVGPDTWNCSGCGNSALDSEMTRDCPQRLLTGIEKQLVSQGLLNYIDGNWWSRRRKKDNFVVGLVPLADLLPDNAGCFCLICSEQYPLADITGIKFCPECLSDLRQIIMERKYTKK